MEQARLYIVSSVHDHNGQPIKHTSSHWSRETRDSRLKSLRDRGIEVTSVREFIEVIRGPQGQ